MRKVAIIGLVVLVGFLLAGAAYAWWGDCGIGYWKGADVEAVKKFQKETLSLRNEVITKRLELHKEFHSPTPNTERITTLRKEIVDLQAKIQAVADKHGVSAWGPIGRMKGHGMMKHCRMMDVKHPCPLQQ